jgi:hypothetical protein
VTTLATFTDGLEPLRTWFNGAADAVRLVAIQSPT